MEEVVNRLIPKHKGNVSLDFMPIDRFIFNINYQYVDQRNDAFFDGGTFATTKVVLDSYKLVNATAKYELFQNRMSLFGTVSNIFNEDFVENIGYNTRGRNFKIGMVFNFE
jgi:vitamin B12 transporter